MNSTITFTTYVSVEVSFDEWYGRVKDRYASKDDALKVWTQMTKNNIKDIEVPPYDIPSAFEDFDADTFDEQLIEVEEDAKEDLGINDDAKED
jgi:hypothetical protein